MNRSRLVYICTIVLSLFCLAPLQAAKPSATQYVQVFEYLPDLKHVGAEAKRIPLSNVEVTVLGAGTVSTDHNGVCKLDFLTKQPGDELHFRRVYKAGYEILNPVQTNVIYVIHSASDTIPLVMITHENQARRAELFSKFAETQYANQMAAEKARLDKSDAEYEASLKQIELDYQQKLDNIENYIRTLSRMDFTALSGKEKEAFDMYLSGNYDKAIEMGEDLRLSRDLTNEQVNQINHIVGKSYFEKGNYNAAIEKLDKNARNDKSEYGAESAYYSAVASIKLKKYDEAENKIFDLSDNFSAYDYWVAKSFIALADVYVAKENYFQAKETLRSVIDNYKGNDLKQEARAKLAEVERLEPKVGSSNGIEPIEPE